MNIMFGTAHPNRFAGGFIKSFEGIGRDVQFGVDIAYMVLYGPGDGFFQRHLSLQVDTNPVDQLQNFSPFSDGFSGSQVRPVLLQISAADDTVQRFDYKPQTGRKQL
jgi:hypothetical protein